MSKWENRIVLGVVAVLALLAALLLAGVPVGAEGSIISPISPPPPEARELDLEWERGHPTKTPVPPPTPTPDPMKAYWCEVLAPGWGRHFIFCDDLGGVR